MSKIEQINARVVLNEIENSANSQLSGRCEKYDEKTVTKYRS